MMRQHVGIQLTVSTDVYADGDLIADVTEIPDVFTMPSGLGVITDLEVLDSEAISEAFTLFFTRSKTSWGTVNDPISLSAAVARSIIGRVSIAASDYEALDGVSVAFKDGLSVPVQGARADGCSLLFAVLSDGTANFSSAAALDIEIGLDLDVR